MPTVPRTTDFGPSNLGLRSSSPALEASIGGNPEIANSLQNVGQMLTKGGIELQEQVAEQHRRDRLVAIRVEASRRSNRRLDEIMKDPNPHNLDTAMERFQQGADQDVEELTTGLDAEMSVRARESLLPHLESQSQALQGFIFNAAKDYSFQVDKQDRVQTAAEVFAARRRGEDDYAETLIKDYVGRPRMFFSPADQKNAEYDLRQTEETLNMNDLVGKEVAKGNFENAYNIAGDLNRFPHIDPEKTQDTLFFIDRAAHSYNSHQQLVGEKAAREAVKGELNGIIRNMTHLNIAVNDSRDPVERAQLTQVRDRFRDEALNQMDGLIGTASPSQFSSVMKILTDTSETENDPFFGPPLVSQAMNDPGMSIDDKQFVLDDALAKHNIDQSFWNSQNSNLNQEREKQRFRPPLYQDRMVDKIKSAFKTNAFDFDPQVKATRQSDSLNDFYKWLDDNPGASEADMEKKTREILRSRAAIPTIDMYAVPDYLRGIYTNMRKSSSFVPEDVTEEMVDLAVTSVKNDKEMKDGDRNNQLRQLDAFRAELQRLRSVRAMTADPEQQK